MKYDIDYKKNPQEYRKRQSSARRRQHPVRYLFNQARHRAKKFGHDFDIVFEDLVIPTHCPVFGIPLFFEGGKRTANSYSLDRWDNKKGYVKGNVRVISFKANQYKGDMTTEEVRNLLAYMEGISHSVPHLR